MPPTNVCPCRRSHHQLPRLHARTPLHPTLYHIWPTFTVMGSDHLPIVIELQMHLVKIRDIRRSYVNWTAFTDFLEELIISALVQRAYTKGNSYSDTTSKKLPKSTYQWTLEKRNRTLQPKPQKSQIKGTH